MGFLTLHVKSRHCYFSRDWSKLTSRAGTLSLRNKRLQNMTLITFKYLHFPDYPRHLKDMFYLHFSDYFLRGQNIFCLPKPSTISYGINFLIYLAAKYWNSLPDHYHTFSDFNSFRRLIMISTYNFNGIKWMNFNLQFSMK